jgi:hypothetical protein
MITFNYFHNSIENVLLIMKMKYRINSANCYRQQKFDLHELGMAKLILTNAIQKRSETEHFTEKQES